MSTDYVFDGQKGGPYVESDTVGPVNVYGTSKLAADFLVKQTAERWLILRIASVFGKTGSRATGGNFIETILSKVHAGVSIPVVDDIWMSPTHTMEVAHALDELIQQETTGLYHASNGGRCSLYEFAREAVQLMRLDAKIEPVSSSFYLTKAPRPKDSSLDNSLIRRTLGRSFRPWQEALRAYLVEKGHLRA